MLVDFSKKKFDIIIQAGQSNSQGSGVGKAEKPFAPKSNVWYLNQDFTYIDGVMTLKKDFTIERAEEFVWGNMIVGNFSLSFADRYLEAGLLDEGRELLIIRAAVGGTGFLDGHWKPEDDLFLQMTEMIKTAAELNAENRFAALLWHQGETDASAHADHDTHYKNLSTLVKLTRKEVGDDRLPFIAGDLVQEWVETNAEICAPVVGAMRDVCRDLNDARFVETDGLISNKKNGDLLGPDDHIHFCRDSLQKLGERYFDAYSDIIRAK